jgi:hypothetical protein
MLKNQGIILLIKVIVLIVIVSILAWMFFYGGCYNSSRLRWHKSSVETFFLALITISGSIVSAIYIIKYIYDFQLDIFAKEGSELIFEKLII